MNKNLSEFQNCKKILQFVLTLTYLDICLMLLALLFSFIDIKLSNCLIMVFISFALISMLITSYFVIRNRNFIKQAEEVLRKNTSEIMLNKAVAFQTLMKENLFFYHFQPIVDAKNGEIFAYEALMRTPQDTIGLQPMDILDLAAKNNLLYDLEKYTFRNTLKFLSENIGFFQNKKIFINSISGSPLNEEDYNKLYVDYGYLFEYAVMEIMDTSRLNPDNIKMIGKRLGESKLQLALDNYGANNCTEANLINFNPNYIKIDGSYLRYIQVDPKKQNILTNLISFASQNNIKVIAEGIETRDELEAVISLGVDYIQGFYTATPSPEIIQVLPEEISSQILEINNREFGDHSESKRYEVKGETMISPVALALEMYTDIVIYEKEVCLKGNQSMVANLSIIIPDNQNCLLTLDQVSLQGKDKPSIVLGKNCSVIINLIGDNYITFDGIRVPETSHLKLAGDGNLFITAEQTNRIGIGGTHLQSYGNITFAMKGAVKVKTSGSVAIGIGGGQNPNNSLIRFISGVTIVETTGFQSIGVGNISGNSRVSLEGGELKLTTEGTKAVGMGSMKGYVDIESYARVSIKCNGKYAVGIGSQEDSDGKVIIQDGTLDIKLSAYAGAGIGAMGGRLHIQIINGDIEITGNGSDIVGLGDHSGFGDIRIMGGTISIQLFSIHSLPIGNINRNIIINGGNIQCDFPDDIIPVNSYGTPLVSRLILSKDEFNQTVDTVSYSYVYRARYSERYPYIKVYLPENVSY